MAFPVRRSPAIFTGCAVLVGLIFFCAGLALMWFLGFRAIGRAGEVESWDKAACTLKKADLTVSMNGKEPLMRADALYEFTYRGQALSGSKVFDDGMTGQANEIEEILHGLRSQAQPTVYVNPGNPAETVLVPPSRGTAYLMVGLGATFALIGLLVMLSPLLRRRSGWGAGPLVGVILTLVFAITGGVCLWFAMSNDSREVAARMTSAPCTILSSRVEVSTTRDSHGRSSTTYRPDILFKYDWQGRTWHSEWTDFSKNNYSTSSFGDSEEVIRRHPVGAARTCWVDPQQPWFAVLEKNERGAWLLWLIGGIFGGIGLIGLIFFFGKAALVGVFATRAKPAGPPPLPPS